MSTYLDRLFARLLLLLGLVGRARRHLWQDAHNLVIDTLEHLLRLGLLLQHAERQARLPRELNLTGRRDALLANHRRSVVQIRVGAHYGLAVQTIVLVLALGHLDDIIGVFVVVVVVSVTFG